MKDFFLKATGGYLMATGAIATVAGIVAAPATGGASLVATGIGGAEILLGKNVWDAQPGP